MIWFTADLHLGHRNIIKWRTWATCMDHHDQTIIDNWNDQVKPDDVVYVLGDIVMGSRAETLPLVDQLNGHKLLVPGNHDHVHPMHLNHLIRWYDEYRKYMTVLGPEVHLPNEKLWLCHFPFTGDHTPEDRYSEWRPTFTVEDDEWTLHGHTHSTSRVGIPERQINVGVDAWNFAPVSRDELLAVIAGVDNP